MALPPLKGPFTVDTYQRLGELGILGEDDRVELIDGQVVAMSPIGDRHASCVRRLNGLFARQLLDVAVIDVQNPVVLGQRDAPQPDVTLLAPRDLPGARIMVPPLRSAERGTGGEDSGTEPGYPPRNGSRLQRSDDGARWLRLHPRGCRALAPVAREDR
jgi:hypothetical protein